MGGKKDKDMMGRKSLTDKYDPSGRKSKIPAAYPNTTMVDLQVYVVPREKWILSRRLYRHNVVEEGISLGFVRVLPQLSIHNLRREIQLQLGADLVPRDFTFVRSVGNIFVQLKPKQEMELKVKNFIPPFSTEPEIYMLEVLPQDDSRMVSPLPMLLREDTPPHICHELCHHSRARKPLQLPQRRRDTESPQPTTPFPQINLSPSPTPSLSSKSSCTTQSMRIASLDRDFRESQRTSTSNIRARSFVAPTSVLTRGNSIVEDEYDKYYEEDTFIPISESVSPPPVPDFDLRPPTQEAPAPEEEEQEDEISIQEDEISRDDKEHELSSLMHEEEVTVSESQFDQVDEVDDSNDLEETPALTSLDTDYNSIPYEAQIQEELPQEANDIPLGDIPEDEQQPEEIEAVQENQEIIEEEDEIIQEKHLAIFHSAPPSETKNQKITTKSLTYSAGTVDDHQETKTQETAPQSHSSQSLHQEDNEAPQTDVAEEASNEITDVPQLFDSLEAEVLDTVSIDTLMTASNSSPETIIHNLKSSNPEESDAENPGDPANLETEKTNTPPPSQGSAERVHLTTKHELVRQASVDAGSDVGPDGLPDNISDDEPEGQAEEIPELEETVQENASEKLASHPSDEEILEESIQSPTTVLTSENNSIENSTTLRSTPPSIITTPASAQGERTEPVQTLEDDCDGDQGAEEEAHESQQLSTQDGETDNGKADKQETNKIISAETLQASHEPAVVRSAKRKGKSGKKPKPRLFPNPRKPSNYPQRTNKVTLARQALAREKRRVYVEERIQSYIKNAQAHNLPLLSLPIALSSETETGAGTPTDSEQPNNPTQRTKRSTKPEIKTHKGGPKPNPPALTRTHPPRPSIRSFAQTTSTEDVQQESKEEVEIIDIITTSTLATTTTTTSNQHEIQESKLQELEAQFEKSQRNSPQTILPLISNSPKNPNSPIHSMDPISPITSIQVARVHSNNHRRNHGVKSSQIFITPNPPPPSHPPVPLPIISMSVPDLGFKNGPEPTTHSIFAIPSNNTDLSSFAKSWKGIEHHGYFYSFRVRQSGPVQVFDKSVQTGTTSVEPILAPQSHSYTLSFSQTHSSNSSYIINTKDGTSFPLNSNLSHEIITESTTIATTENPPQPEDRDKILRDITETVQLRHDAELRRADLVQRANDLQTRVKEKRDKINRRHEFWHKKYIEESSLTRPLEASCSSLRAELNTVHRRLLAHLEGRDLPLRLRDGPSKKANYKIMAARLQHEIKELQQKVKAAKLRLDSEIKLKEQADREVREIRNDLSHKKVIMSLARSQVSTLPAVHSRSYESLVY